MASLAPAPRRHHVGNKSFKLLSMDLRSIRHRAASVWLWAKVQMSCARSVQVGHGTTGDMSGEVV